MKYFLLLFVTVSTAYAEKPTIGIIYENINYYHWLRFKDLSNDKTISQLNRTFPVAGSKMQITYDGKIIGSIILDQESKLKKISKDVKDRLKKLQNKKRYPGLLTTSAVKFSDPEGWKLSKSSLIIEGQLRAVVKKQIENGHLGYCSGIPEKTYKKEDRLKVNAERLKVTTVYAPQKGKRLLVYVIDPICQDEKIKAERETSYREGYWIFRDEKEKWSALVSGPDKLIDIGDYDGQGVSQAIFYSGFDSPEENFTLWELQSFQQLGTAGVMDSD